jgi:methyl-accepting chemotaxis protein
LLENLSSTAACLLPVQFFSYIVLQALFYGHSHYKHSQTVADTSFLQLFNIVPHISAPFWKERLMRQPSLHTQSAPVLSSPAISSFTLLSWLKPFRDWSLFAKISALVIVAVTPLNLLSVLFFIPQMQERLMSEKREAIRSIVQTAYSIITDYAAQERTGALSQAEAQKQAAERIRHLRYKEREYFWINNMERRFVMNPYVPAIEGIDLSTSDAYRRLEPILRDIVQECKRQEAEGFVSYKTGKPGVPGVDYPKLSFVKLYKPWGWVVGSGIYIDDVEHDLAILRWNIIGATIITGLLSLTIGLAFAWYLARSIRRLNKAAKQVAQGNHDVVVAVSSADEIGNLAQTFNIMLESVRRFIDEVQQKRSEAQTAADEAHTARTEIIEHTTYLASSIQTILQEVQRLAEGDLTIVVQPEATHRKQDKIKELCDGLNGAVQKIRLMMAEVVHVSNVVASSTHDISTGTAKISAGINEQHSQTLQISSAVEEMTHIIAENRNNATRAANAARTAERYAHEGGAVMKQTIQGISDVARAVAESTSMIERLNDSSKRVRAVVHIINDIAEQTNLLALNASIEAARAGEQGRGFAVVAEEVRNLAEKTVQSTRDITEMINLIRQDTQRAVQAIEKGSKEVQKERQLAEQAEEALANIIGYIEEIHTIIESVAASSEELSITGNIIARSVDTIRSVSDTSAVETQEIALAINDLSALTTRLKTIIQMFKVDAESLSILTGDKSLAAHNQTLQRMPARTEQRRQSRTRQFSDSTL